MKQVYVSLCEFCDTWFWDQADCEQHEAEHFLLTRREYLEWRQLCHNACTAAFRVGYSNNERTRKEFDAVIAKLIDFEEKHALTSYTKKPSDFYR